ncbi:thioredoxin family protein [Fulvimarina sp. 2208YS6-2-32]|uniref:Thioredoxin family protein n=1 Tax=Fulvimarina uroteuthidis TaxID=3098149 RepID=A0ABU5I5A1_9HYPH|nr:thioredoxin family protein [Fulvimarina sp. 2208YS6-2-32]MDY8110555.1 thioredoxin family protein [Fulvimarina sp. 2208YS6-2-32]
MKLNVRAGSLMLAASLAATVRPAVSAELLVFEQAGCPYCLKFDMEIAPDYAQSEVGRRAPLRRVDIFDDRRGGYDDIEPAVFTPTFVMIDDAGEEVGRLQGYPGRRYFYGEIQPMFDRLAATDQASKGAARPAGPASRQE